MIPIKYPVELSDTVGNHAAVLGEQRAELERLATEQLRQADVQATDDTRHARIAESVQALTTWVADRQAPITPGNFDGARVQACLDLGAAHVHLPAGIYDCPEPLRFSSNTRLTGDGAILRIPAGAKPDPYVLFGVKGKSAANVHISGITFDGGALAGLDTHPGIEHSHLVSIAGVTGLTLERVTILRPLRYSLLINSCTNVRIKHSRIVSADGTPKLYQRDGFHILNSSDVDVFDCEGDTQDDAFVCRVVANYTSRGVRFRNCRAKSGVYGYRFVLAGGAIEDAAVLDCEAYDCGHGAVQARPWTGTPGGTVKNILIRDTIVRRCPKAVDITAELAAGVRVAGTEVF